MKRLLLAALLALSIPMPAGRPDTVPLHGTVHVASKFAKRETVRFQKDITDATKYIQRFNKAVPSKRAHAIACAVVNESWRQGFSWRIFAAVLAQESHFMPDLHTSRGDMGLGQINWPTWGDHLALDKHRLIHDDVYNIGVAASILGRLHRLYGSSDVYWWSMYHDYRAHRRAEYEGLVIARL